MHKLTKPLSNDIWWFTVVQVEANHIWPELVSLIPIYTINLPPLLPPLLPLPPSDSLFFLTLLLLSTCSLLIPLFPPLDIAQLKSLPPLLILSLHYLRSASLSHTSNNSTPTFPSPTFTLLLILCPLSSEHITTPTPPHYCNH